MQLKIIELILGLMAISIAISGLEISKIIK